MKKLVVDVSSTGSQKFDYQGRAIQIINYPIDCVAYIQFGREQTIHDLRKKILKPKNFFDSFEIIVTKAPSTYYKKIVLFIAETSDELDYVHSNDYTIGLLLDRIDQVIESINALNNNVYNLLVKNVDNTYDIALGITDHASRAGGGFTPQDLPESTTPPDIE